jgi:hypothetical protein
MTLESWLDSRRPPPPPRLMDRMRAALHESGQTANTDLVQGARAASIHLLRSILAQGEGTRAMALDLLAADALMTYACESACEQPESIERATADSVEAVMALSAELESATDNGH